MPQYSQTCRYLGLQPRDYIGQPPAILINTPSTFHFNPLAHQLSPQDCEEALDDLLSHSRSREVVELLIEYYSTGRAAKISELAAMLGMSLLDVSGYEIILRKTGMIYPGMQPYFRSWGKGQ